MQVSCQRSNVFGIYHYPRKYPNGNDKGKQHPDLASPQKHKRFAETSGIPGILPKHDTEICRMDIIDDKFFAKKQKIQLGTRSNIGINEIEKTFCHQQTLAIHDPEKQTELQTDVSDKTIKAMVFQQGKFLDYYSKKLTPTETNYITGDKEMFAVVITVKHWRHLTQKTKHKVLVHIDHKKLMFFLETKQLSPRQVRWLKNSHVMISQSNI